VHTDDLKALALDFAHRMSALDWLTDALLIVGMYPSMTRGAEPGTRTVEEHVILIGPTTDEPPVLSPIARSTRSGNDWIRVWPWLPEVMDQERFHRTLATGPRPVNGKAFNFIGVHFTRRHESGGYVRFLFAHNEELDQPGAKEKLADDGWVHDAVSVWLDGTPTID
jgi:hypothetical protein